MRVPIAVQNLKPGMLVVELDIPWLDSPFLTNTRRIKDFKDVELLIKAGAKQVIIDTGNVEMPSPHPVKVATVPLPAPPVAPAPKTQAASAPEKRSVEQEMAVAKGLRTKIKKAVDNLQASLERNVPVEISEISPLIDQTLNSLTRNNQALLNLVHLSRKAQKLADHSFSTFCLCLNLAMVKAVSPAEREALGVAALLHEAGWVQLPLQLMGKRTPYTATEKKLIGNHIQIGLALLKSSNLPELAERIVREHHELCDGSGYPSGLKAENLHSLSKLLTVVDAYDEKVHQLADKPGMVPTNALRALYVEAERGLYDIASVAGLISLLGIYPVTSAVRLNTGERGVVVEAGDDPLNPVIKIVYDVHKKLLATPLVVDLKQQDAAKTKRTIEAVLDPSNSLDDPFRRLVVED